jgi:RecA-family ATPase
MKTINPKFNFNKNSSKQSNEPPIDAEMVLKNKEELLKRLQAQERTVGMFEVESANEAIISALNSPDPEYLYDLLIQEKELIIVFSDTGVGKTVLAVQMAIKIARDGKVVLYVDLELSKKQFQRRYTNDNKVPYLLPETLFRVEFSRLNKIPKDMDYTTFFFDSLRRLIIKKKAQVLFLDNLTKLAAGDTDSAKATIPILEELNNLKREFGLTIIAIEHTKKVDNSRPIELNDLQGSKMKANLIDSAITIGRSAKDKNIRYIKQMKVRDGEHKYDTENVMILELTKDQGYLHFNQIGFSSEHEHLKQVSKEDRQELIEQAKQLSTDGKSQREIAKELGVSVGSVNNYLRK